MYYVFWYLVYFLFKYMICIFELLLPFITIISYLIWLIYISTIWSAWSTIILLDLYDLLDLHYLNCFYHWKPKYNIYCITIFPTFLLPLSCLTFIPYIENSTRVRHGSWLKLGARAQRMIENNSCDEHPLLTNN